jgi:hypothetical protein
MDLMGSLPLSGSSNRRWSLGEWKDDCPKSFREAAPSLDFGLQPIRSGIFTTSSEEVRSNDLAFAALPHLEREGLARVRKTQHHRLHK